jgi:hypothetical protein
MLLEVLDAPRARGTRDPTLMRDKIPSELLIRIMVAPMSFARK